MYSDLEKELQVELLTLGNISELLYVVETLKIFFLIVFFFLTISFHFKNSEVLGLVFFFCFSRRPTWKVWAVENHLNRADLIT